MRFALDLGAQVLRVTAVVGVFVAAPAAPGGSGGGGGGGGLGEEDALQLVRLMAHCEVRLPPTTAFASDPASAEAAVVASAATAEAAVVASAATAGSSSSSSSIQSGAVVGAIAGGGDSGAPAAALTSPAKGHCRYLVRPAKRQPSILRYMPVLLPLLPHLPHLPHLPTVHPQERPLMTSDGL